MRRGEDTLRLPGRRLPNALDCGVRVGLGALSLMSQLAWNATRLTLLALLITLEPIVRLVLTLLTVLLIASAALFSAARPEDGPGPLSLIAAAILCALALLGWYAAVAVLQRPHGQ